MKTPTWQETPCLDLHGRTFTRLEDVLRLPARRPVAKVERRQPGYDPDKPPLYTAYVAGGPRSGVRFSNLRESIRYVEHAITGETLPDPHLLAILEVLVAQRPPENRIGWETVRHVVQSTCRNARIYMVEEEDEQPEGAWMATVFDRPSAFFPTIHEAQLFCEQHLRAGE